MESRGSDPRALCVLPAGLSAQEWCELEGEDAVEEDDIRIVSSADPPRRAEPRPACSTEADKEGGGVPSAVG
jgi:hypothetical protein